MGNRKNYQKLTILILVVSVLALSLTVQIGHAEVLTVTAEYEETPQGADFLSGTYSTEDHSANAQTFNATVAGYLSEVSVQLQKLSTPTGELICYVYDVDNTTSFPIDGTLVATSMDTVSMGDITDSYLWYDFPFSETVLLTAGNYYSVVVAVLSEDNMAAGVREVYWAVSNLEPEYVEGQTSYWMVATEWDAGSQDHCFEVTVSDSSGLGTEGTGWQTGDTSELIEDFASFIVPIAVMLLPAILFIIFFKRTDKWLILIGLAIGTGLGYYFGMIPVWLVFLVAIGLIGLAYSEVRRNG